MLVLSVCHKLVLLLPWQRWRLLARRIGGICIAGRVVSARMIRSRGGGLVLPTGASAPLSLPQLPGALGRPANPSHLKTQGGTQHSRESAKATNLSGGGLCSGGLTRSLPTTHDEGGRDSSM
jgi:hypothetical protein